MLIFATFLIIFRKFCGLKLLLYNYISVLGRELSAEQILDASDRMFNAMGNTAEMVQQAKIIARATSSLVQGIKLEAETQNDSDSQTKLLAAAKQLADATARMVEAARAAAQNPNDENCQLALQQVCTWLRPL